jgi:hypothetical protein
MVRNLTETAAPSAPVAEQRLAAVERLGRLPVLSATVRRVIVEEAATPAP